MKNESKKCKVYIEKMSSKDLLTIFKIGKAHWKNDEWLTMVYLKNSFRQHGLSFVAKIENKVIGGIILVYQDIVKNWIRYLIIDEKYRRQGTGRLLIEKILSKLKKEENVFVDTGVADKNAVKFYEKMGFVNRGTVRKFYGNEGAYFLEKKVE